jgi:type IV pilus assembly protein PilM
MAEMPAVWGIEIGQAGLKAIRLRRVEGVDQVVAAAFDYVPHPKLLSQPDAVPDELIRQALDTFLSRNQIGNDLVAISLPGQTALAKFIQLPPVEQGRVAEIVKYEARQQIPFALEDVIWDFQTLGGGGAEESGFLLDAEVGLFAMKKEQVAHHLKPFLERKIEVELVQIAPLGLFNFVCFDRLGIRPDGERPSGDEYTVLLDMGADATTLLVTNGKKIWIRNVPIGGNHFTRALTKEMKLTFAKAEHLKCNATKSPDPRAVFQALRPVFNDYVNEIQRSIGFFSTVNRSAKIGRLVGVGNGFKLAGLQKFLQQNLQYEVDRVDHFQGVVGDHVLAAPLFQDNLLTFVVPYGLALQTLKLTDIHTSLLPKEIAVARMIRRKKPWAVATAATLLFGMAASAAGYGNVWHSVSVSRFGKAEEEAKKITSDAGSWKASYSGAEGSNSTLRAQGDKLMSMMVTREQWLEVYKAINECLPRDEGEELDEDQIEKKNRISINSITCKKYDDLSTWTIPDSKKTYMLKEDAETAPAGAGYVFTLFGEHYHHEADKPLEGVGQQYVNKQLLANLQKHVIERPDPLGGGGVTKTDIRRMGITHAVSMWSPQSTKVQFWPNGRPGAAQGFNAAGTGGFPGAGFPGADPGAFPGAAPGGEGPLGPAGPGPGAGAFGGRPPLRRGPMDDDTSSAKPMEIRRTEFMIQFAWKPTLPADRKDPEPPAGETPADGAAPAEGAAPVDGAAPATTDAAASDPAVAGAAAAAPATPATPTAPATP